MNDDLNTPDPSNLASESHDVLASIRRVSDALHTHADRLTGFNDRMARDLTYLAETLSEDADRLGDNVCNNVIDDRTRRDVSNVAIIGGMLGLAAQLPQKAG